MRVCNEVLRERYQQLERQGLTYAEVAGRCGWTTKDRRSGRLKPDTTRVARSLGLLPESGGGIREWLQSRTALLLCDALHLDPHEIGL